MAVTSATIGTGCVLRLDPDSTETTITNMRTFAEIQSASFSNGANEVDVTALDQSNIRQFLVGSRGSTMSFNGNFLPDTHDLDAGVDILTQFQARATLAFSVVWNDGGSASTATGTGFLTALSLSAGGHDDAVQISGTLRIQPTSTNTNGVTYTLQA